MLALAKSRYRCFVNAPKSLTLKPGVSTSAGTVTAIEGPAGLVTRKTLPTSVDVRWTSRRKAQLVLAVGSGLLSSEDAFLRYKLSQEEFLSWQESFRRSGMRGLHITKSKAGRPGSCG